MICFGVTTSKTAPLSGSSPSKAIRSPVAESNISEKGVLFVIWAVPTITTFALSDLSPGTSGRITGLLDDGVGGVLVKRLRNLGFVPGRIATPLRRAPMGDPVVYRVSDYELCLRRKEARLIQVTTVEAENRIILQPRPAGRHAADDPAAPNTGETL